MRVIDPHAEPSTVHPRGLGEDVLSLQLPVHRPDVLVPVVELFLDPGIHFGGS